jgi:phosphatidylserine/phosphatidylglycerophosphate/cardiolipin synthase-like enzyme
MRPRLLLSLSFLVFLRGHAALSSDSALEGTISSQAQAYATVPTAPEVSVRTYLTPYQDGETHFLQFLDAAKSKCYIASYSITNPNIINKLVQLHSRGVDVEVITDKTQASGRSEQAALMVLQQNRIPLFIGKSADNALMHCKFVVVDDYLVEDGSWNFTCSASRQDNVLNFSNSKDRAKQFMDYWLKIRSDMKY